MKEHEFNLHDGRTGAAITVHVTPGSSHTAIDKILEDGTVTIKLAGAQNETDSNQALVNFIAEVLKVKPSQVEIIGGISGSDKLITIMGLDKDVVQSRILKQVE